MHIRSLEDLCVENCFDFLTKLFDNSPDPKTYIVDISLPERPSQKMLERLLISKNHSNLLRHFSPLISTISNICLDKSAHQIDDYGFLNTFNLTSFSTRFDENVELEHFLGHFNEQTRQRLGYLRLRHIRLSTSPLGLMREMRALKFLDLSKTNLRSSQLREICENLPSIVGLNISSSEVDDLSSLSFVVDRLEFLDIHYLPPVAYRNLFFILNPMTRLRYLDMSEHGESIDKSISIGSDFDLLSSKFLSTIRLIDLSGNQNSIRYRTIFALIRKSTQLKTFVYHPEFVSLSRISQRTEWKRFIRENPQITFIGAFSKYTILNSLIYSLNHGRYLPIALHLLFERTRSRSFFDETLNSTVICHMQRVKPDQHDLLITVTAVVYNLTKGCLAERWPIDELSELVRLLINFLDHPNVITQLVVNCFLIICNDFIIQHARYDKLRLSQLVFRGMRQHDIDNINQAGVIIISVIASELSKSELCQLVDDDSNFQSLLTLICRKCVLQSDLEKVSDSSYLSTIRVGLRQIGEPIFDFILKFALSSLWNLTDECTAACKKFVQHQGLLVYFIMIKRFENAAQNVNSHIYNKCLGLLNNIAEEEACRSALLTKEYLDFLNKMLNQEDIQMTYFAGGILSNLLLISNEEWKEKCEYEKSSVENRIYSAVDSWVTPNFLMASYRSFSPFENLIANAGSSRAILLWSLWAIRHTMKIERKRYSVIFERHPRLIEYVEILSKNQTSSYGRIRSLATDILILFKQDVTDDRMMVE